MGAPPDPNGKCQYDSHAESRRRREDLPYAQLEHELLSKAIGDSTDSLVLDLAGGSGSHARLAIAAGAKSVDVVDLSASTMEIGEEIETQAGRNQIRWVLGDTSLPLSEQAIIPSLPKGGYDLVLAIGAFDLGEYEGVWKNIATYLKPGGRLISSRMSNPHSRALKAGKYGARLKNSEQIPGGGIRCQILVQTDPPYSYATVSMEESLMGDKDLPESLGVGDTQTLKAKDMETVKKDQGFWRDFVQDPYFVVFTAKKKRF